MERFGSGDVLECLEGADGEQIPTLPGDRLLGPSNRLPGFATPSLRDEIADQGKPGVEAVGRDVDRLPIRRIGLAWSATAAEEPSEPHPLKRVATILRGDPLPPGQRRRHPPSAGLHVGDDPLDGGAAVSLQIADHLPSLVIAARGMEHDCQATERGPLPASEIDCPLQFADRQAPIPADLGDLAEQPRHHAPTGAVDRHLDEEMPCLLEIELFVGRQHCFQGVTGEPVTTPLEH